MLRLVKGLEYLVRYGEHETFNRRCNLFQSSPGVYPADAFVGWYNGHPDYKSVSDSSYTDENSLLMI